MMIAVGSKNNAKVLAVKEILQESPFFSHLQMVSFDTPSGISDQPLSLQETTQGAKNRARNAFSQCEGCIYGFGIESGLMESIGTTSGFLHISICSIYDGEHFAIGMSNGFELPQKILDAILDKKMNLTRACLYSGISKNERLGSSEGLIGILTKGKVDRKEYSKQSIRMALLQLENADWYLSKSASIS